MTEAMAVWMRAPLWLVGAAVSGVAWNAFGLAGSVLLAMRHRATVSVFIASLFGYVALFAGDHVHGVFDVSPGQMTILSLVVVIAAALLGASIVAPRRNLLR